MFAGGVSDAFLKPLGAAGYVGPVSAQRMLIRGFVPVMGGDDGAIFVALGSRKLIGPAGKQFAFRTAESALTWISINVQLALREKSLSETMPAIARDIWLAKKRVQLDRIANTVIDAAARARSQDVSKALVAESDFCAAKWD